MAAETTGVQTGSSLDAFIRGIYESMEVATTIEELLEAVAHRMRDALKDPGLLAPDQLGLIYEDPDALFNVSSAMSAPGHQGTPHGAGGWVVYGVHSGAMQMTRYERADGGSNLDQPELRRIEQFQLRAGETDTMGPGGIHAPGNTTGQPARNFVVRSRVVDGVLRGRSSNR